MRLRSVVVALVPAALLLAASSAMAAPQTLGALFEFNGTLVGSGPASGSIYDGAIHSGVPRDVHAPPSGLGGLPLFSDSYVLQGGDPFGGDTGDAFEMTQATGHAVVSSFFDVFTNYTPPDNATIPNQVGTIITSAPDTGYLTFVNNSAFEFQGTMKLSGQAFGGIYGPAQFFSNSGVVDLLPGQSKNIVLNNESSNYGGYNHPDAIPDAGSTAALLGVSLAFIAGVRRKFVV